MPVTASFTPPAVTLRLALSNCGVESKFFLVKFLQLYGTDSTATKTIDELMRATGMSARAIGKAIKELTKAKYLLAEPAVVKGKGRMAYTFNAKDELDDYSTTTLPHHQKAMIDDVLRSPLAFSSSSNSRTPHPLSLPQKLLLATLLAHSQENFIVKELGLSQLCSLTGMLKDRVDNHIEKLRQKSYIRAIIPGITGKILFGQRPSIYYLHSTFRPLEGMAFHHITTLQFEKRATAVFQTPEIEAHMMCALAMAHGFATRMFSKPIHPAYLADTAQINTYRQIMNPEPFLKDVYELLEDPNPHLTNYLQAYLEELAGILLCKYAEDVHKTASAYIKFGPGHLREIQADDTLIGILNDIMSTVFPPKKLKIKTDFNSIRMQKKKEETLAMWILNASMQIAVDTQIEMINNNISLDTRYVQFITEPDRKENRLVRIRLNGI